MDDLLSDNETKKNDNKENVKEKNTKVDIDEEIDEIEEIDFIDDLDDYDEDEVIIVGEVKSKRKGLFGRKK